eukprot:2929897-Pyramimonas_sp.AAC.1
MAQVGPACGRTVPWRSCAQLSQGRLPDAPPRRRPRCRGALVARGGPLRPGGAGHPRVARGRTGRGHTGR